MKHTIIVDIDGTIADVSHRVHYLEQEPKDWDSFYSECDKDTPIEDVITTVNCLSEDYDIVFCTGRRESEREKTLDWLNENYITIDGEYELQMRQNGDTRHDTIVKPELLRKIGLTSDYVVCIFEDRNSMVKKWRELGYTCMQVAEGDF